MLTEDDIRRALRDCYDLELPCNVIDLGMICSVVIELDADAPGFGITGVPAKHRVDVGLTLAHASDAAEAHVRAQIVNRLAGLETVSQTTVTVMPAPLWTPQAITAAGRRVLGLDGNPSLVQIR